MKYKVLASATLAGALMTGCGTKTVVIEKPAETTEAPATTQAPEVSADDAEQVYLDTVADEYPDVVRSMGKKWIIDFGYLVCDEIDNGLTFDQLLQITTRANADATQVGFMTGAAIRTLCPENMWFIDTLN